MDLLHTLQELKQLYRRKIKAYERVTTQKLIDAKQEIEKQKQNFFAKIDLEAKEKSNLVSPVRCQNIFVKNTNKFSQIENELTQFFEL
jgi:hypothetical protein